MQYSNINYLQYQLQGFLQVYQLGSVARPHLRKIVLFPFLFQSHDETSWVKPIPFCGRLRLVYSLTAALIIAGITLNRKLPLLEGGL